MAIFRVEHNSNYTVMSNNHFKEKGMSLKAKGLLSLMLSLPPEWDYTEAGLASLSSDGITSVKSALKELEEFGYLERARNRDEKGHLTDTIYNVYEIPKRAETESPKTDSPMLENLMLGNPMLENHMQLNTNKLNTNKKLNKDKNKSKILDSIISKFTLYDFSEAVQDKLIDFYSDRIEAKQKPTEHQLIATLDLLAGVDEKTQLLAIDNSIRGGWKTIYLPKASYDNKQSYRLDNDIESLAAQKARVDNLKQDTNKHTF